MNILKKTVLLLSLLPGLLLIQGCGDDTVEPVIGDAEVLFVHAAPDAAGVDFLVGNNVIVSNLLFGTADDEYRSIEDGAQRVRVTDDGDTTSSFFDASVTFEDDTHYTIFAVQNGSDDYVAQMYEDDLTEPASGKALIRIANLSPDAPSIKLAFLGSGLGPIFQDVTFLENTNLFTQVDAEEVTIRIQDNASTGGSTDSLVPDVTMTLQDGGIYTIALIGRISDATVKTMVVTHEHD